MKILFIPIILLAFFSCNSTNTDKQDKSTIKDTVVAQTENTNQLPVSSQLDSIDKANAASITLDGDDVNKAYISKKDSSIDLVANMKMDHRIFGYEKPDTNASKKILFSIFTNDVKDNPFHLVDGAYYSTSDMQNMSLKFVGYAGNFVKVNILKADIITDSVFIKKSWVEFGD